MINPSYQAARAPALLTLFTCLLSVLAISKTVICQQTQSKPPTPFSSRRQNVKPLVFTVTVTNNKGAYVTGLDKSNFIVLDEKAAQDITYFKGMDEPVSVGILLDVSRSMFDVSRRELMKTLFNEALVRFIQQSNGSNEYFLIGFNERPQLLMEWTSKADDLQAALRKIGSVGPKGHRTALYDACYLGIEKLGGSRLPKRAIVLISDGMDNNSHYTFKELRKLLAESDVSFYIVGINDVMERNSALGMEATNILDELAKLSGGISFYPEKPFHVRDIFEHLAAELRQQYSIGFNPANYPGDREWHRIKIKLALPPDAPRELRSLSVRSREGYYPDLRLR